MEHTIDKHIREYWEGISIIGYIFMHIQSRAVPISKWLQKRSQSICYFLGEHNPPLKCAHACVSSHERTRDIYVYNTARMSALELSVYNTPPPPTCAMGQGLFIKIHTSRYYRIHIEAMWMHQIKKTRNLCLL